MPEPIKYSDLIKDDGAIQSLIDQLTKLVNEYEKAQDDIKASAEQSAKAMQGLSGATDEQRQEIARLAKEAEEMAQRYSTLSKEEAVAQAELKNLNAVNREYVKIQQLKLQEAKAEEGSYNKLSAQYRLLKMRINEMGEADEKATKRKREAEAQARKLYEQMSNLQKATGKYTLEVGHYENALKGLPGPLGKVIGLGSQWRGSMAQTKEAIGGLAGSLGMSTGGLMAVLGGVALGVGGVVGAFKLWMSSAHETQATGDALDAAMAGWDGTWAVFQKAVSTFDFSGFIRGAIEASSAAVNLKRVLDESFERTQSTRLMRANIAQEQAELAEAARNVELSYQERLDAVRQYLKNMEPIYEQEQETAKRAADAQLEYLFSVTNRTKFASDAEREAAKQRLQDFITNYAIDNDQIDEAKRVLEAEKDIEGQRAAMGYAANKNSMDLYRQRIAQDQKTIDQSSDHVKELAHILQQYNLTNDKQVKAFVDAQVRYRESLNASFTENRRYIMLEHQLQKQIDAGNAGGKEGSGGGGKTAQSWSLQNDKKFQEQRLALLRQYQAGEIATREDFDNKVSELEIETLQKRLDGLKANSSERGKIEAQLIEKQIALRDKLAAADEKALKAEKDRRDKARKEEEQAWINQLQMEMKTIELEIAGTEAGTEQMYRLRLAKLWKAREIEIAENNRLTEEMRQDEALINAKYDKERIDLAKEFGKNVAQATTDGAKKEAKHYGDIWDVLGLKDGDIKDALNTTINAVTESISSMISSWERAAEAAVESANKQVDAAQSVLDAERNAASEGYANNVRRAERELALAKKNQAEALKEQEKAQKAQAALDTITQANSLITASANLWSAFSPIPYVGPALAVAAIALMWGSFAASKIKASQVAKAETYGEGTVELLQGGSHASGNDISLGRKSNGVERRAEGGEYFAVINKRNSRKYHDIIPDVINSFNDGTFADKYQRANSTLAGYAVQMLDLSHLERGVDAIRQQGENVRSYEGGAVVLRYKNLTRKIKS